MTTSAASETTDCVSRWDTMSDFTRIAVGLAAGLAVATFVVLCSMAGPLIRGACAGLLEFAWRPWLSYERVTQGYLAMMYAGVIAVGVAHARRTTSALAAKRPKTEGKPPVGASVAWTWYAVMALSTVVGMLCGLFQVSRHEESLGCVLFAIVAGAVIPWIMPFLIQAMLHADTYTVTTYTGLVQTMGLVPALVLTVMGFSVVNLGLLLGLWMMMGMLAPLEDDALPSNYPDSFE